MIVIVEGLNRTGKTTVCDWLHVLKGFMIYKDTTFVHHGSSDDWRPMAKGLMYAIVKMLPFVPHDLVIDRFHLTELAYGLADRGYCIDYFELVDRLLFDHDARLIYMTDTLSNIEARVGRDLSLHYLVMEHAYQRSVLKKTQFCLSDGIGKLSEWLFPSFVQLPLSL